MKKKTIHQSLVAARLQIDDLNHLVNLQSVALQDFKHMMLQTAREHGKMIAQNEEIVRVLHAIQNIASKRSV